MRRWLAAALAFTASCTIPGWQTPRDCAVYRSEELESLKIQRIAMLPFYDECNLGPERERVERAFADEVEKVTGYEVLRIAPADMADIAPRERPRRTGRYRIEPVLDLAVRYGADAILFGTVTSWRPYAPQAFGLRMELVSSSSGLVAWSLDARYDLLDGESERALKSAFHRRASRFAADASWEIAQISPGVMLSLVCAEAAASLAPR
ncbi:MAG: hypothetical protein JNJ88_00290 [Planctomycetes bacterium]|nr:hypothetical protein [Planctomycetota bacterium]